MRKNVAIRLGGEGAPEVKRMFDDIATSGDTSAIRLARSFEREGKNVEAAIQRQANTAAKLEMAYGGITPRNVERFAGNRDDVGKSAQASALVFNQAYMQMETRARALVFAIDPAAAAQDRFNAEMVEARALVSAGVLSLDQYVAKLRVEQNALDQVSAAHQRGGVSAGAHRQAMIGVSYQVQDFFTQISMGANPINAFAVQGAQLAGQFANVEGKAGSVARFLMGPWGLAITGGLMLAGMFTKGLFEQGESLDDLVEKLRKDAEESQRAARAKDMFRGSIDGLDEAMRMQNDTLRESINLEKTSAERAYESANANVRLAEALTAATRARLEDQRALLQAEMRRASGPGEANERAALNLPRIVGQIDETEAALERIGSVEQRLRQQLTAFGVDVAIETGKRSNDAIAMINRRYDGEITAIRKRGRELARAGQDATAWAERETAAIEKRREASLKEAREREQKTRTPGLGTQINAERSAQLLMTAQRYNGLSENTASGRSSLRTLFSEANQNIDPKMVAWCAAFVNAVLATNGLPGTNSLAARSFLDYGTATNKPQMGDIVVLKRGSNQAQGHVGFYAGEQNGKVMVTGGNQGDAVSTAGFNRRDVLGFRRAPTDAATFKDEAQQAREYERDLARLTERYDPLSAAAARYAEELQKIAAAQGRNEIGEEVADRYRRGALNTFESEKAKLSGADVAVQNALKIMDQLRQAERQRDKSRADALAQMMAGQEDSLALARGELSLTAANDNVREGTLAKLRLILDLKRLGVSADSAEGAQLIANQATLEDIYQQIERQRRAWDEIRGFGTEFADTVLSPSTWEDWGEGGRRILDMLKSEFIKLALLNPLKNMINGDKALPTLGSIMGLFAGGGGVPVPDNSSAYAAFAASLPRSAAGTHHSSGGAMLLGEFGPELAYLPRGSQVSTANDTRRLLAANDRGRAGPTVNIYADRAVLADEVRTWVADGMALAAAQGAAGGAMMGEAQMAANQAKKLGRSWG
ncbi:TIGR02594 family protein [Sphingomonas sp. AX6]|uniref:TIGR02594 family protein n=1 Tax=Sphingomonas sp. AX6 TaxID=2653171 RepID=UPI0012EF4234|nr:TIGR02594 family protein [Sphingomonas sp. AX6]VXC63581.1 conserved hypothetical protein [Sphingomonas sp. AX6]